MKVRALVLVFTVILVCTLMQELQSKASNSIDYYSAGNQSSKTSADDMFRPVEYTLVEGGTFMMGTADNADYSEPDEFPTHQVTISPFIICKHEVTQAEFNRVMNYNPSCFANGDDYPVERVNWYNAIEYCNRLSIRRGLQPCYTYTGHSTNPNFWPHNWNTYFHNNIVCNWNATGFRLPTEAEWEFAAKGGNFDEGYTYSGSNDLSDVAWYWSNSDSQTHPILTKLPNQLGIFNMTGNIQEWCWDWYGSYTGTSQDNPRGPDTGLFKVRKGGAWDGNYTFQRITNRTYTYIMYGYEGMGFRVVRKANH